MTENPHHLSTPEGRIAYALDGPAPGRGRGLVVTIPGMGDLRSSYRFLAPALADAGFTVAAMDLRGHGDSDTTFRRYGDVETAGDVVALVEELGAERGVVLVGNSMGAGAAVIAAAELGPRVAGLVLTGPFVRDPKFDGAVRLFMRVYAAPAWVTTTWRWYMPRLFAGRPPVDLAEYLDDVVAAMRRPGHAAAFSRTARTRHDVAARTLDRLRVPALVVMGDRDPDFADPAAEAAWIAGRLDATTLIVPEAGHYPQSQRPDVVTPAVLRFLQDLPSRTAHPASHPAG